MNATIDQNSPNRKGEGANRKGEGGAVVYTRFSPRPDAAFSESCEYQLAKCEEFAARKGLVIRAVFNDPDRSGADGYREQLWRAIDSLRKGDTLIVYRRDRLARDVYLYCCIEDKVSRKGARIAAENGDVDGDGPTQRLTRIIVAAISEYERQMIRQKTSDAMKSYQRAGRRMSARVPYGWRVRADNPKLLERDEEEQRVLSRIMKLRKGGAGFEEIARALDAAGIRQRNGNAWFRTVIRQIIRREESFAG